MTNKKKSEKGEELTLEMANALLKAEEQAKIQRCREKIHQALAEEGCLLECSVIVTAQGNIPQLLIRVASENERQRPTTG